MSSISTFAEIPKWMRPGGQLWGDPRIQNHWQAVKAGKEFADAIGYALSEQDMVEVLTGVMGGTPYVAETDQERNANSLYVPPTSSGEFWVLWQAQKEAERFEDRPREDWPEWANYQDLEDVFLEGLDDEPLDDEEDNDVHEFIPGTSPWQEHIDGQRSKMVADMASAHAKGKKWATHKALMVVALTALDDGMSYERSRELGFMAYHASFKANIGKVRAKGLVIACADFSTGKRTTAYKLLPWKYVQLAMPYLHPAARQHINAIVDEISIFIAGEQERRQRVIDSFIAHRKARFASI